MKLKAINRPACPKCGSIYSYVRITTREFVCRRCGCVWRPREES
jgi:transcription initiation factor TFIIIB Brf1 subunit/transcription initiation factor TFIIB